MNEAEILDYLTTQGIDYEYQRHPAMLTMDEAERLALPHPECEARNLFVRESRTHRYFLLTAHARVDLKAFSRQQGLRSLSFCLGGRAARDPVAGDGSRHAAGPAERARCHALSGRGSAGRAHRGPPEHQHRHGVAADGRSCQPASHTMRACGGRPLPLSALIHPLYLGNL